MHFLLCTHGEMDITTVFGTVILGSNPGGCTAKGVSGYSLVVERILAKDESGVRFSLPAQHEIIRTAIPCPLKIDKMSHFCGKLGITLGICV